MNVSCEYSQTHEITRREPKERNRSAGDFHPQVQKRKAFIADRRAVITDPRHAGRSAASVVA
jgi:hypothetical protein